MPIMQNAELARSAISKAMVDLAALAPGGIIANAQSMELQEIMTKSSKLLGLINYRTMTRPKEEINQTLLNDLVLHPVAEGGAVLAADYAVPTYEKVVLDPVEYAAEMRASGRALMDSIEDGKLRAHLMGLLAKKCKSSMEKIVIQSDTGLGAGDLAAMDGILVQATDHQVDLLDQQPDEDTFYEVLLGLPQQFREDRAQLMFFTSQDAEERYRKSLKNRFGSFGDGFITGSPDTQGAGVAVTGVPYFPEDIGTGAHCTDLLLTDPMNIHVGVWKEFTLKTDENISTDDLIIVLRTRFDVKVEVTDATALGINLRRIKG